MLYKVAALLAITAEVSGQQATCREVRQAYQVCCSFDAARRNAQGPTAPSRLSPC